MKAGFPATEIVRIAESSTVDLLVIGPPRQWTSTTQAVLAKSLCPVLVTHDARPLPLSDSLRVTMDTFDNRNLRVLVFDDKDVDRSRAVPGAESIRLRRCRP